MKLKNISCTQFAGVRDINVNLTDGINVIYGKNESGKSTLVNLLSRILFQKAKLDRRSDKEFSELYFPGARKGGRLKGDFADGEISFEGADGSYTISKEWGVDSRCTLSTPDGVIRDQDKVDEILKNVLLYGEGVYTDMLFSSQRNTDMSLQTILDASKKTDAKQELANVVAEAFSESDGISMDEIEAAITAKIDEIAGKHWDSELDRPTRKPGAGRWSKDLGEILKAYYAMEDAKAVLDRISQLEAEADRTANDYIDKENAARSAEEAYNSFNGIAGALSAKAERKKTIARIDAELNKITAVLEKWPELEAKLEKAKALESEKTNRELKDQYEVAKLITDDIKGLKSAYVACVCPSEDEITIVRNAERKINQLENKLCGMNISAAVSMSGGHTIELSSLRTGERLDISDGTASITEAVKLTVPGIMEMILSPADVDAAKVEAEIADYRKALAEIFDKYKLDSSEALSDLAKAIHDRDDKIEQSKSRLNMLLGSVSFDELEAKAAAITGSVRTKEDISADIRKTCGSTEVSKFVIANETVLNSYKDEYGSINELKARAFDLKEEKSKEEEAVSGTENIPAEYLSIQDPDAHLKRLKESMKNKQGLKEKALTDKTSAASILENFNDNLGVDPLSEAEKTELIFNEQKELLKHWQHIYKVFKEAKSEVHDSPMQDIAESLLHYLKAITGGKVSSEFPEADKLNMNIYSDDRLLDYGKLSEGTKETVSLAFRLAVLDHLFPEGGGVIVLDDPFTDMDAERTAQSCKLLKKCAKKHQVIFLTCREDYISMLNGNRISF